MHSVILNSDSSSFRHKSYATNQRLCYFSARRSSSSEPMNPHAFHASPLTTFRNKPTAAGHRDDKDASSRRHSSPCQKLAPPPDPLAPPAQAATPPLP